MAQAVIFDVDGTLVDSVDQHAAAWHDAFAAFGHDIPASAIRSQIGKGGDQLLPVFLNDEQVKAVGPAIERRRGEILRQRYLAEIKAFPAVRLLFQRLIERGIRIALASSAKQDELEHYKEVAQITDLVEEQTSSDDAERSKPHPDIFQAAIKRLAGTPVDQMVVVGDTPWDAKAASNAGLRCVGVLSGGFAEQDLREAGCVAIFRDPADLADHLDDPSLAGPT